MRAIAIHKEFPENIKKTSINAPIEKGSSFEYFIPNNKQDPKSKD